MPPLNNKGITLDGLLYQTDLSNPFCWYAGDTFIYPIAPTKPITKVPIVLQDYNLRMHETGVSETTQGADTVDSGNGLVLRVYGFPYKTAWNNPLTLVNDSPKVGNYIKFDSYNFLWSYFKLEGYDYEVLPARYAKGFTIETTINFEVAPENYYTGDIIYLGTRDSNIFGTVGQTGTTTEGTPLGPDHPLEPEKGVEGNAFSLGLFPGGKLGYKFVNNDLTVEQAVSDNSLTKTGWHILSFNYTPCFDITDPDLLECTARRSGKLDVYVNGVHFHEFKDFPEPMFKGLSTEREKQIGVPYMLGWCSCARQGSPTLTSNFTSGLAIGAQILRIYERPLSFIEVRGNHNALAPRYDLELIRGGRITPSKNW